MCEDCKKEKCDCKKDVIEIDLTTLINWLEKTGAEIVEVRFVRPEHIGKEIFYGIREKRDDEQGED